MKYLIPELRESNTFTIDLTDLMAVSFKSNLMVKEQIFAKFDTIMSRFM